MGTITAGRVITKTVETEFLATLVASLREFKNVKGVFLAGSGAHDEFLWWHDGQNTRMLSDIEVGIVVNSYRFRKKFKQIAENIGQQYSYEVEVFLVTPGRLKRGSPKNLSYRVHSPNILMYDIIEGCKWLWRDSTFQSAHFDASDFPAWEGIRLILNRIGEGSEYLVPWMLNQPVLNQGELQRWLIKLLLATGDAILINHGEYRPGYGNRARVWRKNIATKHVPYVCWNLILQAYDTRLGKPFELDNIDAVLVRDFIRQILIILMNNQTEALDSIEHWLKYFRMHEIPVRFQAPIAKIDGFYDSVQVLPSLVRSDFSLSVIFVAINNHVPLQVFAYGVVACGVFGEDLNDSLKASNRIVAHYFRGKENSTPYLIKEWWDALCK